MRNLYENPERLGADRWAALIGARALHPHACVVVTAGTATTVDLLSAAGDFLGGLILPGVELMQQALARGTAQLPLADGRFALQPRRTVDAIRSGCLQAQAGAVERMFRQIADAARRALPARRRRRRQLRRPPRDSRCDGWTTWC